MIRVSSKTAIPKSMNTPQFTVWKQKKDGETHDVVTNPWQEDSCPINRHRPSRAGLDNGNDSWQVRDSSASVVT